MSLCVLPSRASAGAAGKDGEPIVKAAFYFQLHLLSAGHARFFNCRSAAFGGAFGQHPQTKKCEAHHFYLVACRRMPGRSAGMCLAGAVDPPEQYFFSLIFALLCAVVIK